LRSKLRVVEVIIVSPMISKSKKNGAIEVVDFIGLSDVA
jgi:hypothetical protein